MKNKVRNSITILRHITSTDKYKMIFLVSVLLALYAGIIVASSFDMFLESVLITFQFATFNIFMFMVLFLNTLNACSIFDREFSFYILRLGGKRSYIKNQIKNVIIVNIFHFIIFFLLYFTVLIIFSKQVVIEPYYSYDISNIVYTIFYLVRYIVIALGLCSLVSLIYINFKKSFVTFIISSVFFINLLSYKTTSSITQSFQFLPAAYFSYVIYTSFSYEIMYSVLFILILQIVIYALYKITITNKKWVIG